MKKLFSVLLMAVLLAGCSAGVSKADYDAVVKERDALQSQLDSLLEQSADEDPESSSSDVFDEVTRILVDQDGIMITFKGFDKDSFLGPALKVLIENNTDEAVTVQVRDSSVNGYMMPFNISADIQPGKKSHSTITMIEHHLKEIDVYSVSQIETVEFVFHIFNFDGWDTTLDSDVICLEF